MDDNLFHKCLEFVRQQSCGEWGDEIEVDDAIKLEDFVREQIALRTAVSKENDRG